MVSPRTQRTMQSFGYGIFQVEISDSKSALPYLAQVVEALKRLMRGCTTFMIAHRLGTLANCDARLEIEDGRVVRFEHDTQAAGEADKSLSNRPPAALFELDLDQVSLGRPEKVPKPPHRLKQSS